MSKFSQRRAANEGKSARQRCGRITTGDRPTAQPRSALTGVFGPTCMQGLCQHCIYVSLDEIPPPPQKRRRSILDIIPISKNWMIIKTEIFAIHLATMTNV